MALHTLALEIGMTVNRLMDELTLDEFLAWVQYFRQRNEEPEAPPLTKEALDKLFDR